jgi:Holliday junction DNA helicase RuvA
MIAYLKGKIIRKGGNWVILENQNIGYKIYLGESGAFAAKVGEPAEYWTHEQIREDGREIFGFNAPEDLELFWKIITVSGVGPKTGLMIVGAAKSGIVKKWIDDGDVAALSSIHGVGKKTAQKIILELKGKLIDAGGGGDEAADALVGLGYSRDEARSAVMGIEGIVEERVRAALKRLGRR